MTTPLIGGYIPDEKAETYPDTLRISHILDADGQLCMDEQGRWRWINNEEQAIYRARQFARDGKVYRVRTTCYELGSHEWSWESEDRRAPPPIFRGL